MEFFVYQAFVSLLEEWISRASLVYKNNVTIFPSRNIDDSAFHKRLDDENYPNVYEGIAVLFLQTLLAEVKHPFKTVARN